MEKLNKFCYSFRSIMDHKEVTKKPARMEKNAKKNIARFSKIEDAKNVPYFKFYNPEPDPVLKQEKRKMKDTEHPIKKPKLKMKCITCKDKKKKMIEKEEKKIAKMEKYTPALSPKERKKAEERHLKEKEKYFVCKKEIVRLPSPVNIAQVVPGSDIEFASSPAANRKVVPEKISMTESALKWPPEPTPEHLKLKAPKSKIIINKTKKGKGPPRVPAVDSIDYIYDPKYRRMHPWYQMYRAEDTISMQPQGPSSEAIAGEEEEEEEEESEEEKTDESGETVTEEQETEVAYEGEGEAATFPSHEAMKARSARLVMSGSNLDITDGEEEGEETETEKLDLSMISAQTSVDSGYRIKYPSDEEVYDTSSLVPNVISKILQKYQRESEIELVAQIREPFKRGTIKSHSTSKVPNVPVSFYFGVKTGNMHYGDVTFSERSRYRQGLTMTVIAYIFSFIKHPSRWNPRDIDQILELGDKLYLRSLELLHLHDEPRILQPEELCDVVAISDKKIKYKIHDPDIAGFTKSTDPKIFNLLKGLTLFFKRNRAGILQSYNTNILIWRQKHFYVFDPEPRTQELYSNDDGTTVVANFYDIPSVVIMLLDRGKLKNWPYTLSKISIKKIVSKDKADGDSLTSDYREESLYKIVDPAKAVVRGTFSIADDCFGESRNKQALAVGIIALVYAHVTPACAWHRRTVDKILLVANQFHSECLKEHKIEELKLENVPAFFTVGPLMIDITIFANQYAGLMYRKSVCLFEELLTKFFYTNTSALVEIDKYALAIWKSRGFYYTFDPYQRDREGLKLKGGVACVTMNTNIECLVKTVVSNFPIKDYVFKIHILKVVRINRDPEYGKLPRSYIDSEESIIESLKVADRQQNQVRNIIIDKTEAAMKTTHLEDPLDPSILEVGSYVGSLDKKYVPTIPKCPSKMIVPVVPPPVEKIYDLDSPSLSDTQIERERPSPLREDSFEFRLLEEITREEEELKKLMDLGEAGDYDYLKLIEGASAESLEMKDEIIQKGRDFELGRTSAQMNTDLLGLCTFPRVVMEPNQPLRSRKHSMRTQKPIIVEEPQITQSMELAKPSNFVSLPDDSEVLYGDVNMSIYHEDVEQLSPFVSMMAVIMAKKYTLNTWTPEVVNGVLEYGYTIKCMVEVNFTDIPTLLFPKIIVGTNNFHVVVDYLFDSLVDASILEACLEKLIFRTRESAIVITENYSCAVFLKRTLYYMFDGFGCNLVGMSEGLDNSGVACMFRFKNLRALISRFMYNKKQRELVEPTEASRFVISTVDVANIPAGSVEKIPRKEKKFPSQQPKIDPEFKSNPEETVEETEEGEDLTKIPKNFIGYQKKGKYSVIEGSTGLQGRSEGSGIVKVCHFICVCAMIGIFSKPIKSWDTRRVDYVTNMGKTLFGYIDNMNFADKRNVKNLLFDKYFFDIIIKRITIANPSNNKNLSVAMDCLLRKNKFLLIQFPNCCYLLYKGNKVFHLFDPYGIDPDNAIACWIKYDNIKFVKNYLTRKNKESIDTFFFLTINISKLQKATKRSRLQYKLRVTQIKKKKKIKKLKIFNEDEDWLTVYPTPWSYIKKNLACGVLRGAKSHRWYNWNAEYPHDLYSLVGNLHQTSEEFPPRNRGKQTIANCIIAIVMTDIYDFTEWNASVLDSILKDGDEYFKICTEDITEKNYEVRVEDFKDQVTVFPYTVSLDIYPMIEGTMFLVRPQQFNISKALRYFFESYENRCGIICSNNGRGKTKYLAFGRIREGEFFMYDCQTIGPPMFLDRYRSRSYILRCHSLNRLLHCITVTLRSGDFFIYYVGISEQQMEEEVTNVTDYNKTEGEEAADKQEDEEGG